MDSEVLAKQLIRALRGKRSQEALGRRLQCGANVVYSWEAGRRFPSASRFFQVAERVGVDVSEALTRFLRVRPGWLQHTPPTTKQGIAKLLSELQGQRAITELANATGRSRFRIARWLAGETQPRLPDLLLCVHATSYRLLDFVAALVDPETVPLIAASWRELEAARQAATVAPWCHAVLRLLETGRFADTPKDIARIAELLALSDEEAKASLQLLETSGQLVRGQEGFLVRQMENVDMAADPEAMRRLKAWAAEIGLRRIQSGAAGVYSFNLFCVSDRDYRRLQQLQRNYFRQLRAIVAESTPSERVAMTNLQLFALDEI